MTYVYVECAESTGFCVLPVLQWLWGKPWDAISASIVTSLRPSAVRVTDGEVKSDAKTWRVTVFIEGVILPPRITRIEQEVRVSLPDGIEHGAALMESAGVPR